MRTRRTALAALAIAVVTASPATASARAGDENPTLSDAARSLRRDPVYVAPGAESVLSGAEARTVRDEIEGAQPITGAIYVAVLPDAAGDPGDAAEDLHNEYLNLDARGPATIVLLSGDEYYAGSGIAAYPEGTVPGLMNEALAEEGPGDTAAVLASFINRLESAARDIRAGRTSDEPSGQAQEPSDSGGGFGLGSLIFVVLLILGGVFLFTTWRERKRREELERRHLEEVREAAMEDLVALGDDLRALDLDVEMPGVDPAAKEDYVKALGCYEQATSEIDKARRVQDLEPVSRALEEGRFAMACAKARLDGREPPERRAPCFFDPRHGPSVRDVDWAPPNGASRSVPACDRCATDVDEGRQPQAREVLVGGRPTPYWDAPGYYGPWAGGYFGGFGMLEGLFIGSMLGGMFDHGDYGGFDGGDGDFGDGDGGDEGDFGDSGGDFGGGDFGDFGGDFGGGDFGGGDFGGGGDF